MDALATRQYQQLLQVRCTSRKVTRSPSRNSAPSTSRMTPRILTRRPTLTCPGMSGYATPVSRRARRCTSVPHTSLSSTPSSAESGSRSGSAYSRISTRASGAGMTAARMLTSTSKLTGWRSHGSREMRHFPTRSSASKLSRDNAAIRVGALTGVVQSPCCGEVVADTDLLGLPCPAGAVVEYDQTGPFAGWTSDRAIVPHADDLGVNKESSFDCYCVTRA